MSQSESRKSKSSPSVREKTYKLLRHRLLTGEFTPGQRLTEESIASTLGVSRTPVREALHKLELEGLVKPAGARGFSVPENSSAEMIELFEIRGVMEGHALACLAAIVNDSHILELTGLIDRAEQACIAGELQEVFEYNTRFHDLLYGLLAHERPRLYSLIEDMRDYVVRYRKNSLITKESALKSVAGHRKIVMALNLGDRRLCEQLMRSHVREAFEDALLNRG